MENKKLEESLKTFKLLCDNINRTTRIVETNNGNKIFFTLKKEHILLLQRLNLRNQYFVKKENSENNNHEYDEYKIATDIKRQFGNSDLAWREVAQILQLPTLSNSDEDADYSNETMKIAMLFLIELPVAHDIIMNYKSFEEKEYDITSLRYNSGYFSYKTAKNTILLLDIKNDLEQHEEFLQDKSFQRFYDFFINIRCDKPEDVFKETLDTFSFGDVKDMKKQKIKWLNYLFDVLIKTNDCLDQLSKK